VTTAAARRYDPYNPHPASAVSTLRCPGCRTTQPVFDDPVLGPRCARCGSPVPVVFASEPSGRPAE
jgi:ribosomal protein S27E